MKPAITDYLLTFRTFLYCNALCTDLFVVLEHKPARA